MKRLVFLLMLVCPLVASAKKDFRPMLVEGKTWCYIYHHFEMKENLTGEEEYRDMFNETKWEVEYTLRGDTAIEGRQYMKMYRRDGKTGKKYYHGAFREDEKGRVWQYGYEDGMHDFLICDFTLDGHIDATNLPIIDLVNINGVLLQRYHWNGLIGVEGVGIINKGLAHYLYEPEPDCICDYESFSYVEGDDLFFSNADFTAPTYIELTDQEKGLVEKNNDFAFHLFNKVRTDESNVLSPLSITYALGMLNNGAVGQTQQEIYNVLGFDNAEAQNKFCLKMIDQLAIAGQMDKTTKAFIANTIFVNQGLGYQLQNDFTHTVNQYYYAYPQARDFNDGETRDVINKWASDHTNKMIEEILTEDEFNPLAVSYLLNAIYFKGMWKTPFDAANTQEESFDGTGNVPMMHREYMNARYDENDLYQTISLPFGNDTYNLQVFLPRVGKTLNDLLENLNSKNWKMRGSYYEVDLKLPRFEISTNQNLKDVMSDLGMPSAFNPQTADFSKLCNTPSYIGLMKQMAKIKLDEQGAEAAAVTVIGDESTGIPEYATFHANRPFLYIISEQSTGIILFMGQFTGGKPSAIEVPIAEMKNESEKYDDAIYDLSGRRLSGKPVKGLYIQNGKKVARP